MASRMAAQDLEVAVGPQLDLEDRDTAPPRRTLSRIRSGVSSPIVKVDFGALRGIEPPEPVERDAEPLADQIVQRGGERGARGRVAAQHRLPAALGLLEIERILRHAPPRRR